MDSGSLHKAILPASIQDNLPIDGRIAIRQDEKTGALLLIAVQSKTGFTHSAPMPDESVPEYSAHSTTSLSSRTEIQIKQTNCVSRILRLLG